MSLALSEKAQGVKPSSTLAITAKAKDLRAQGIDVVAFVAGEPDFNTPENISMAAIAAIRDGFTKYTPAAGTLELKRAVSEKLAKFNHLDYSPEQIVISNGGKHSLTNAITVITNPGDEFLIPAPYWLSYPEMVKLSGGVPVSVKTKKENGYKVTVDELEAACTERTKALILNTPCNPTGSIYSEDELRAIADFIVRKDIYVIADEMYEYLVYGGNKHVSIASFGEEIYKRTITCSGLSKSYAMTGWRIGYAASPLVIAKLMGSVQSHQASNPNSIAQKAAYEALTGNQDTIMTMVREFEKRSVFLYNEICKLPFVDCIKPEGAFYAFVDCSALIGKKYRGEEITGAGDIGRILIEDYNVAVIPCDDFGIQNHIRLSYAISMEQIEKGVSRIAEFLNALS
ncbi:MAG: pyridoxal phosphate-dependent aminotransferase [Eubacteriales bacterium]|nr:pyridoxal phosphate-dependent aminotransferase [Eubacteriales bacterium]